jgi:hypothetical protein
MSKYLALICTSLLMAMASLTSVQAGEASRAAYVTKSNAADVLFQRVATKPCCFNDGEYFRSSPSTCRKYGGRVVQYEYCERQYYNPNQNGYNYGGRPCCYNNGQFFNASPRTCRRHGGQPVSQERCDRYYYQQWGDDDYGYNPDKPCCYNNNQYFNTTPKTCRKYGGRVVPQGYCSRRRGNNN